MGWDGVLNSERWEQVTVPAGGASEGWSGAGRAVMSAAVCEWLRVEAGCLVAADVVRREGSGVADDERRRITSSPMVSV